MPFDLAHPGWWSLLWSIIAFFLSGAVGVYVYLSNRNRVHIEHIERIERDINSRVDQSEAEHEPLRLAVARLEEGFRHAPSASDLAAIYVRLNPIAEDVAALGAQLKGVGDTVADIRRGQIAMNEALLRRDDRR